MPGWDIQVPSCGGIMSLECWAKYPDFTQALPVGTGGAAPSGARRELFPCWVGSEAWMSLTRWLTLRR